jgi:predicted transcriptional regulator
MKMEIDISEKEISRLVTDALVKNIVDKELDGGYPYAYKQDIAQAVREVIYKDKKHIVDTCVERATREIKSKAFKEMIDNIAKEGGDYD